MNRPTVSTKTSATHEPSRALAAALGAAIAVLGGPIVLAVQSFGCLCSSGVLDSSARRRSVEPPGQPRDRRRRASHSDAPGQSPAPWEWRVAIVTLAVGGVIGARLGRQYWTDFTVNGRRYRERLGTTNLRAATRRERELIEEAGHGRLPVDGQGPKRLWEAIDAYLTAKRIRCSARTIELEEERLSIVKKHFGDVPLSAISATEIADFQRARPDARIANRTINMDVVLARG
jgi:hypothetical protein